MIDFHVAFLFEMHLIFPSNLPDDSDFTLRNDPLHSSSFAQNELLIKSHFDAVSINAFCFPPACPVTETNNI